MNSLEQLCLSKMTALVTGAYGIFGTHICAGLCAQGYEVLAVGRDKVKGAELVEWLKKTHPTAPEPKYFSVDCGSRASIKQFCATLPAGVKITALVNNVAVTPRERQETADGVEAQWATNVLSYHYFLKFLVAGNRLPEGSRVNFVASFYAGGLDVKDVEFKRRAYDADAAYQSSKQANRMLAASWAKKLADKKITVTSAHPGVSTSKVSLGLGFDIDRSPESQVKGAATPLFCVLSSPDKLVNGAYYVESAVTKCDFSSNEAACEALFKIVDAYDRD
jgi:NAD(P)-dependent dehydrogenase (short-subunit alcohol dehydrogenase family)